MRISWLATSCESWRCTQTTLTDNMLRLVLHYRAMRTSQLIAQIVRDDETRQHFVPAFPPMVTNRASYFKDMHSLAVTNCKTERQQERYLMSSFMAALRRITRSSPM